MYIMYVIYAETGHELQGRVRRDAAARGPDRAGARTEALVSKH